MACGSIRGADARQGDHPKRRIGRRWKSTEPRRRVIWVICRLKNGLPATVVFAYAGLSASQWGHATRMLNAPPGHFWCGNVISDPYGHLVNVVGPAAAVCAAVLVARCVKARRCSCRAVAAVLTFAATSGFLVYEARFLADYGCDVGRPWWLPSWLPW